MITRPMRMKQTNRAYFNVPTKSNKQNIQTEERYREQQAVAAEHAEAERQRKNSESRMDGESGAGNDFGNKGGFIDVDDMKDEKVELSFDNVDVVAVPTKKKKKKKKKKLL